MLLARAVFRGKTAVGAKASDRAGVLLLCGCAYLCARFDLWRACRDAAAYCNLVIAYAEPAGWRLAGILSGIGGALMFIGGALFFVVMAMTVLFGEKQTVADIPF